MWKSIIATVFLCLPCTVYAGEDFIRAESIAEVCEKAAVRVAGILREGGATDVNVQSFNNVGFPGQDLEFASQFAQRLKEKKVVLSASSACTITGEIERNPGSLTQPLVGLVLDIQVRLPTGKKESIQTVVQNKTEALQLGSDGTSEQLPPALPDRREPATKPQAHEETVELPEGLGDAVLTLVRPNKDSPYSASICVRKGDSEAYEERNITPEGENGRAFRVRLEKGDEFEIVVANATDYSHAVDLRLDGMSRFALAKDPSATGFSDIIAPRSTRILKGYYINDEHVRAFLVGDAKDSVAARLSQKAPKLGTIVVTFSAAWKPGESEPPYENSAAVSLGITDGRPRHDVVEEADFLVGKPRAVITFVYDQ